MFHVLLDTSVWLDLAADAKQTPLLRVLEDFIENGAIKLIVPRVVHEEFHNNRNPYQHTILPVLTRTIHSLGEHWRL